MIYREALGALVWQVGAKPLPPPSYLKAECCRVHNIRRKHNMWLFYIKTMAQEPGRAIPATALAVAAAGARA